MISNRVDVISERWPRAVSQSGISGDISPACRETPVRDVVNHNTVSPTDVMSQDIGDSRTYYLGPAVGYFRVGPLGAPVGW